MSNQIFFIRRVRSTGIYTAKFEITDNDYRKLTVTCNDQQIYSFSMKGYETMDAYFDAGMRMGTSHGRKIGESLNNVVMLEPD